MGMMTFESPKYICIKEATQVAIVDTTQGFNVMRHDMKAEAMIMHKERGVLALRANQGDTATVIQIVDILQNPI